MLKSANYKKGIFRQSEFAPKHKVSASKAQGQIQNKKAKNAKQKRLEKSKNAKQKRLKKAKQTKANLKTKHQKKTKSNFKTKPKRLKQENKWHF